MFPTTQNLTDFRNDLTVTGSHEEFWVFNSSSQWGKKWKFSENPESLEYAKKAVHKALELGHKLRCKSRLIHYAQLLIWRFYLKEDHNDHPFQLIIPIAFESASTFPGGNDLRWPEARRPPFFR